jgi:ketosteroid isomerase-like protein
MRRTLAAAVAVASLVLAACGGGGGPSDEDQVRSAVRDYFHAFAAGDADTTCRLLATEARAELERAAHAKNCVTAIKQAAQRPEIQKYTKALRDVKILKVTVAGSDATAKVKAIGQTATVPLHKEDGGWRISGITGAGNS